MFSPAPFEPGIFAPPEGADPALSVLFAPALAAPPPAGLFAPPQTAESMRRDAAWTRPAPVATAPIGAGAALPPPPPILVPRRRSRPPIAQTRVADSGNRPATSGFILSVSGAALLILTFGLSSLLSVGLGIAGAASARRGLARIEAGETRLHGGLARAGVAIGTITAILGVLGTLGWIAIIASEAGAATSPG